MNLTLLVENNAHIESFYVLNLYTWLGLEIIAKKKAEFAIAELEANASKIKLIIVRCKIDKENSAQIIMSYLKEKSLSIPVIEIGPGQETPGCFARTANSLQIKALIQSAAKALNITAKDMSTKVVPDFFPIPIIYFRVLKRSVCDVYSQDFDDPQKFNLRLNKLTEFDEKTINTFIQEGCANLYINKLDRLDFVHNVTSELMALLEGQQLSPDEAITAGDKNLELLSRKLLTIGVNEETIQLANKSMATMRKTVKSNPKLSKLMERLLANKASYLFTHTQVLTYIGLHIIKHIDWGNDEQADKICFVAFFHDIVLEKDEEGMIKSNVELNKGHLSLAQKALVEKHAQIAAEFVSKFPHAPMGADQIIRQHHGTLNGFGFSEHHGNNVSPISVVFIIAEEFTRILLKYQDRSLNLAEMIKELRDEFPNSRFKKVIDLLQSVTF